MTDLKTDQEKAEDLKKWWKENGTSVMLGVALAIGSVLGWQQWQAHKLAETEEASSLFASQKKQADPATLAELKQKTGSPYASLAALNAAKQAAETGKEDQAKAELQWTIDNTPDELIKQVASLQLARLHISTKDFDTAKSLLNQSYSTAYSSLIDELKGDLYLAQDQISDAATAYQQAIQSSGGNAPRYLKMKLDNLGLVNPVSNHDKTGEGA